MAYSYWATPHLSVTRFDDELGGEPVVVDEFGRQVTAPMFTRAAWARVEEIGTTSVWFDSMTLLWDLVPKHVYRQ